MLVTTFSALHNLDLEAKRQQWIRLERLLRSWLNEWYDEMDAIAKERGLEPVDRS
jgi:hypothetical protein